MEIQTSRLLLRPWRHEEAERILALYGRLDVVRWLGDGEPRVMTDLEEAHRAIDRFATRSVDPPLGFLAVEVVEPGPAAGTVAGTVLLARLPGEPATGGGVEIAWHFHPDSQGHGYATEAAGALLDHGFAAGLPRIYALTHLDNTRSQELCRRLGMQHLGQNQPWYAVPMEVYSATPR